MPEFISPLRRSGPRWGLHNQK